MSKNYTGYGSHYSATKYNPESTYVTRQQPYTQYGYGAQNNKTQPTSNPQQYYNQNAKPAPQQSGTYLYNESKIVNQNTQSTLKGQYDNMSQNLSNNASKYGQSMVKSPVQTQDSKRSQNEESSRSTVNNSTVKTFSDPQSIGMNSNQSKDYNNSDIIKNKQNVDQTQKFVSNFLQDQTTSKDNANVYKPANQNSQNSNEKVSTFHKDKDNRSISSNKSLRNDDDFNDLMRGTNFAINKTTTNANSKVNKVNNEVQFENSNKNNFSSDKKDYRDEKEKLESKQNNKNEHQQYNPNAMNLDTTNLNTIKYNDGNVSTSFPQERKDALHFDGKKDVTSKFNTILSLDNLNQNRNEVQKSYSNTFDELRLEEQEKEKLKLLGVNESKYKELIQKHSFKYKISKILFHKIDVAKKKDIQTLSEKIANRYEKDGNLSKAAEHYQLSKNMYHKVGECYDALLKHKQDNYVFLILKGNFDASEHRFEMASSSYHKAKNLMKSLTNLDKKVMSDLYLKIALTKVLCSKEKSILEIAKKKIQKSLILNNDNKEAQHANECIKKCIAGMDTDFFKVYDMDLI